jgi:hypothetical protein
MPQRVQMTRQKPWRLQHPDAVIVARPTKWGNPYGVSGETTALIATRLFRDMLNRAPTADNGSTWGRPGETVFDTIRRELRGRDLACWCPLVDEHGNRAPCHADVLLEIANPDEEDNAQWTEPSSG